MTLTKLQQLVALATDESTTEAERDSAARLVCRELKKGLLFEALREAQRRGVACGACRSTVRIVRVGRLVW